MIKSVMGVGGNFNGENVSSMLNDKNSTGVAAVTAGVFAKMDTNADGAVDKTELNNTIQRLSPNVASIKELLAWLNANADGGMIAVSSAGIEKHKSSESFLAAALQQYQQNSRADSVDETGARVSVSA